MKPSGPYQVALYVEQDVLYRPNGVDITGGGIGPAWTRDGGSGTVSRPALAAGFATEFERTRITSTAAIDNELGARLPVAIAYRGSAASRGGFFFAARFKVNAIPNNAIRFFAGMSSQVGAGVCIANALAGDAIGLWCDSTDNAALSIVVRDNTTTTKVPLSAATTLTAGTVYEFRMICNPGGQVNIVCELIDVGAGTILWEDSITTLPRNTIFMGPQVGLSNAANAAGGDTALDIISIYCRPNVKLVPTGTP